MLLYHYSKNHFSVLKTLAKQRKISQQEQEEAIKTNLDFQKKYGIDRPGYYYEHISFFFSPIPLDISQYYPKDHQVWVKGNSLYEYTVELKDSEKIGYEVVEFPEKMKLFDDETLSLDEYFKQMSLLYKNNKYIGNTVKDLTQIVKDKDLISNQSKYLKLVKGRKDYLDICHKYAATISHVMLYPILGEIAIKDSKLILLK